MESPDQVLAERVIDRRLASDRAVDLREQRRGNLDVIDSAQKSRGDKARQVARHAAAERDHGVGPFKTIGDQKTPGAFGRAQRFRPLAVADQMRERREAGPFQTPFNALAEERVHLRVRDDSKPASLTAERGASDLAGLRQRAVGDDDVVTTLVQGDMNYSTHKSLFWPYFNKIN